MGLFGPSLNEKIRRRAAAALPQAEWQASVDWSTGAQLHRLSGTLKNEHTDAETMQFARDVWQACVSDFRLHPDDGRDGLLDVRVTSAAGVGQSTGVQG